MSASDDLFGKAVHDALHDDRELRPSPDLFSRVVDSIDADRLRRRRRRTVVALWAAATCAVSIGILWVKPSLQWRVVAGIAAIPCLFLLGFEGGWWLIPAVIVDTIISVRLARTALTQRAA